MNVAGFTRVRVQQQQQRHPIFPLCEISVAVSHCEESGNHVTPTHKKQDAGERAMTRTITEQDIQEQKRET